VFSTVGTTAEPERANPKLVMGRPLQWFEMVRRISPFVGYDLVEFGCDTVSA
jgi:hypothetical protein